MKKKPIKKAGDKTQELSKETNSLPVEPEIISEAEDKLEEEITLEEDFQEELEEVAKIPQRAEIVERIVVEKKKKEIEEPFAKRVERFKKILSEQPKVLVIIPKEKWEPENAGLPVQINGVRYLIRKGEPVEVPRDVATLVNESIKGVNIMQVLKEMSSPQAGKITLDKTH